MPEQINRTLTVRLAAKPVDTTDIFLFHKTTFRHTYESAIRDFPEYDDVLLWNESGELTESTVANIVAEIDGKLYTPPVSAGLLRGTFRARLLEQGKIRERALHVSDIKRYGKIYLINSVRKWREAVIVD